MTAPKDHAEPKQRGLGLPLELLSITVMINPVVFDLYAQFQATRKDGAYTTGLKDILKNGKALMRERYGYLRQRPDLGKELLLFGPDGTTSPACAPGTSDADWKSQWSKMADELFDQLDERFQSTEFTPYRDTFEPITAILESPNALGEIKTALQLMRTDAECKGQPKFEKAKRYRDFLSALFLFLFELRMKHYSELQLEKHLIQRDGKWFMKVLRNELKCPEVLADPFVLLELPEDVAGYVETYLKEHRPLLVGADQCSYFFLASRCSNSQRKGFYYLEPESISKAFSKNMFHYTASESGFGGHAVRKIVSSVLNMKNDYDDTAVSSGLAMNSGKVNKKHYTANYVQSCYSYHIHKLQEAGVLKMPAGLSRKVLVDESTLERQDFKIREQQARILNLEAQLEQSNSGDDLDTDFKKAS